MSAEVCLKHVRFTVPGTHESHVWVSLLGDADVAIVNGRERTVTKCCVNCWHVDSNPAAEVQCPDVGKVWPRSQEASS